ncbi:hypothetical protein J4230_00350 [Candidatus Woesearchaeota archaeon]|nr:hypothetical protein [Candidatus Woesearchaeota archaeon]
MGLVKRVFDDVDFERFCLLARNLPQAFYIVPELDPSRPPIKPSNVYEIRRGKSEAYTARFPERRAESSFSVMEYIPSEKKLVVEFDNDKLDKGPVQSILKPISLKL